MGLRRIELSVVLEVNGIAQLPSVRKCQDTWRSAPRGVHLRMENSISTVGTELLSSVVSLFTRGKTFKRINSFFLFTRGTYGRCATQD